MTYSIGPHRIDVDNISTEDWEVLCQYPEAVTKLLKTLAYMYITKLNRIVQLYLDAIVIYRTLILKIPHFDQIDNATNKTRQALSRLETDLQVLLDAGDGLWQDRPYHEVSEISRLCCHSAASVFKLVVDNLTIISQFFTPFTNLEKLLIPYAHLMAPEVARLFATLQELYSVSLPIVDELPLLLVGPHILEDVFDGLSVIDHLNGRIQRECKYLETAFQLVDNLFVRYSQVILGKGILRRDLDVADCQLVRRREVCHLAAEQVVLIPLSEQSNQTMALWDNQMMGYVVMAMAAVVLVALYRIYKVLFS